MNRQDLDDGTWFDLDGSQCWEEGTRWDGANHVSLATGSQWDHQTLYRTKKGRFILRDWSNRQGEGESYEVISPREGVLWLVRNKLEIPDDLSGVLSESEA